MEVDVLTDLPSDVDLSDIPEDFNAFKSRWRSTYLKLIDEYFGGNSTCKGKNKDRIVNSSKRIWTCLCGKEMKVDPSKHIQRLHKHIIGDGEKNSHPTNEWRIQAWYILQNKPILRFLDIDKIPSNKATNSHKTISNTTKASSKPNIEKQENETSVRRNVADSMEIDNDLLNNPQFLWLTSYLSDQYVPDNLIVQAVQGLRSRGMTTERVFIDEDIDHSYLINHCHIDVKPLRSHIICLHEQLRGRLSAMSSSNTELDKDKGVSQQISLEARDTTTDAKNLKRSIEKLEKHVGNNDDKAKGVTGQEGEGGFVHGQEISQWKKRAIMK